MSVKVRVRNFQSLKDAEFEVKGLTALTGPNNSGKSAIVRAIRGVFQNTPGTSFVRHGEDECQVDIRFGDGRSLTWKKGTSKKSRPTYVIDGGTPIYPGRELPEEVVDFGVTPIKIGDTEVWPNIASQFTGQVFLLDRPGSALAEAVADVERVTVLNEALRRAESDRRSVTATLRIRQDDEVKTEAALQRFAGLDDVLAEIQALEEQREYAERVGRAADAIQGLRDNLVRARGVVTRFAGVEDVALPQTSDASVLLTEVDSLVRLQVQLGSARERVANIQPIEHLHLEDVQTDEAERLRSACDVVGSLRDKLIAARQTLSNLEESLVASETEATDATETASALLADLGECPTCGSALDTDHCHG